VAKFIGRRVNVGIGKETSRGTAATAVGFTIPKTNYTFEDKANKALSGDSFSNIAGSGSQAIVTGRFSEGAIEGEINANSFGLLLLATLGTSTPAAYATSAYEHTLTLNNSNQHTTLTIFTKDPIGDTAFKGCMIDSLEITVAQNEIVKYNAGFKGRKGNDWSWTAAYAVDYKFVSRDLELKVATATANLAAATAISVKELKLTINKNAENDWVLGTLEPEDVLNRQITFEGTLTLNYEDRIWRNYMLDGSTRALGIKLTNTRQTIGSAGYPEFYIEFPVVEFSEWESKRDNDDVAGQTIKFTALYDIATSKIVSSCYVRNTTASY
jgi:hypothetical protein